jgi:hypothetical protein
VLHRRAERLQKEGVDATIGCCLPVFGCCKVIRVAVVGALPAEVSTELSGVAEVLPRNNGGAMLPEVMPMRAEVLLTLVEVLPTRAAGDLGG